ncbi:MAG: hypothetical protein J5701_05445 [Bacteroidales bacterium]|nr:hypothetical protein [Bacteroidales bacterium]
MKRYSIGLMTACILLASVLTQAQKQVYHHEQIFSYYFEKHNPNHLFVFQLDSNCQLNFFKFYVTLATDIFQYDSTHYGVRLYTLNPHAECPLEYKRFLLKDSIFASIESISADIKCGMENTGKIVLRKNDIQNIPFQYDTLIECTCNSASLSANIAELKLGYNHYARLSLLHLRNNIDNYYKCDSLFAVLHTQLDRIDTSFVDRYPIYIYDIQSVESELTSIDSMQYERMLVNSGLDTTPYSAMHSALKQRIAGLRLLLQNKLKQMDELYYSKAWNMEQADNNKQAEYYYLKSLEYNPAHCNSIIRLSRLYTRTHNWQSNYALWRKITIRGDNLSCKNNLINNIYDSLYAHINKNISAHNYYDALKIVDTAEMFAQMVPTESSKNYLPLLKHKAQEGIYVSYYEIIGKALRINKLDLAHTYSYGLGQLMQQYDDSIQNHDDFKQLAHKIMLKHQSNIQKNIGYKRYNEALDEINATRMFADSLKTACLDFNHEYTAVHTSLYDQKLHKIQQLTRAGNTQLARQLSAEAEQYYNLHKQYIQHTGNTALAIAADTCIPATNIAAGYADKDTAAIQKHINELSNYIHLYDIKYNDYSLLDSFLLLRQLQIDINSEADVKTVYLMNKKLPASVNHAFTRYNQYVYCNDFEQAKNLLTVIEKSYDLYLLDTIAELYHKKQEAVLLLDQRLQMYMEEEFRLVEIKSRELIKQGQYLKAYTLLHQKQTELQNKNLYSQNIYRVTERIYPAAMFQEKQQKVDVYLNLHLWDSAFTAYTDLQDYYQQENLQRYRLQCDSIPVYFNQPPKQKYLPQAAVWYLKQNDRYHCMEIYNIMKANHMLTEKTQTELARSFLAVSNNPDYSHDFDWLAYYSFGKEDKPFLTALVSPKVYRYIIHK